MSDRLKLPRPHWVDTRPLPTPRRLEAVFGLPAETHVIAFDLDETLLVNSWVGHEYWSELPESRIHSAWNQNSRPAWIQNLSRLRGQRFLRPWINRLPFLYSGFLPTVELRLRDSAVALLQALRQTGVRLILVTASSKVRVQYLSQRLPWFFRLFENCAGESQVICGEDLEAAVIHLRNQSLESRSSTSETPDADVWQCLHRDEPPSLALKTPAVIRHCFSGERGFDLLIDDSESTAEAFRRHSVDGQLISVDGRQSPQSPLMRQLAEQIGVRLGIAESLQKAMDSHMAEDHKTFHLEDPFYLPLLRTTLQVEVPDHA